MKLLLLSLLINSAALACPNITGNYSTETPDEKVAMQMTQKNCWQIDYVMTRIKNNQPPETTTTSLKLDGQIHKVSETKTMKLFMAGIWLGNNLNLRSYYFFNGPKPERATSHEIITKIAHGHLRDKGVYSDSTGNHKFEVIFNNDHR